MTLGQCLDEVRKIYLNGDREVMGDISVNLIKKVKRSFAATGTYPNKGWLLELGTTPYIYNSQGVRLAVDLVRSPHQVFVVNKYNYVRPVQSKSPFNN